MAIRNQTNTVYDPSTDTHNLMVWAEDDSQLVVASDCIVTVKDHLGTTVWTETVVSPNADGVFHVAKTPILYTRNTIYYAVVETTYSAAPVTTFFSFSVVG